MPDQCEGSWVNARLKQFVLHVCPLFFLNVIFNKIDVRFTAEQKKCTICNQPPLEVDCFGNVSKSKCSATFSILVGSFLDVH